MIKNQYGSIDADTQLSENKDLCIYVYDENGEEVVGKEAIKKKMREILEEERRLNKDGLLECEIDAKDFNS